MAQATLVSPDVVSSTSSFAVTVDVFIESRVAPTDVQVVVYLNGQEIAREEILGTTGGTYIVESEPVDAAVRNDTIVTGENQVDVDVSTEQTRLVAGTFTVEDDTPGVLSSVVATTANRNSIVEGEFVKLTVVHRSWTTNPVRADLVVNRVAGDTEQTLFTDEITSYPQEESEVVPVKLEAPGDPDVCAFLTNRRELTRI